MVIRLKSTVEINVAEDVVVFSTHVHANPDNCFRKRSLVLDSDLACIPVYFVNVEYS